MRRICGIARDAIRSVRTSGKPSTPGFKILNHGIRHRVRRNQKQEHQQNPPCHGSCRGYVGEEISVADGAIQIYQTDLERVNEFVQLALIKILRMGRGHPILEI